MGGDDASGGCCVVSVVYPLAVVNMIESNIALPRSFCCR